MTAHDFLRLAVKESGGAEEVEWRSAVSRAYYATFHAARELFQGMGFQVPRADPAHAYLSFRLQNCGHGESEKAGRDFHALRQARNRADYDLTPPTTAAQARAFVAMADQILQTLALAGVESIRTQVRDAVIGYERTAFGQTTWKP